MADNYIKQLLGIGVGTEGSLLIVKKIYDTLVDEAMKKLIPRGEAAIYLGPGDIPGSSVDVDLVVENKGSVREIAEGGELPIDNTEYTSSNLKPKKYGVAIRITSELLEDAKWNILQNNVMIFGRRFAENENSLIITALDNAANTVSGGAAVTIPNITVAMEYLEEADKEATSFAVGNEVLQDLRNIDTFVEANKIGNREMLATGFLGVIYGMNVIRVSSNAGMTKTSAYVYDRSFAFMIAEKRPITVQNFQLPAFDMSAASITQRLTVATLRTNAIAKITSS